MVLLVIVVVIELLKFVPADKGLNKIFVPVPERVMPDLRVYDCIVE